jgi:RNA polymerase sigma-70 factor (ECF subfamily)
VYGRVDPEGNLLLLREQDRTKWNQTLIEKGKKFLNLSSSGEHISSYHIEAAITFEHCSAKTCDETNWKKILQLYEWLSSIKPDPVVVLNKLIATAEVHGIDHTLPQFEALTENPTLKNYYLLYASLADLYSRKGDIQSSNKNLEKAIACVPSPREKEFLLQKLRKTSPGC